MALHEMNGDHPETFPPDIRTEEARSVYRMLYRLSDSLTGYENRSARRFDALEQGQKNLAAGVALEFDSLREDIGIARQKKKPTALSLPPMRKETPSSVALLDEANVKVVEKLTEMAQSTPGPKTHVEAKPEELAAAVRTVVSEVFQQREHATNAKILRWQRGLLTAGAIAFVTSVFGAAGLWTWGKAQGHAEAAVEARTPTHANP